MATLARASPSRVRSVWYGFVPSPAARAKSWPYSLQWQLGSPVVWGYLAFAAAFAVIIGIALFLLSVTRFGETQEQEKDLRITIPEELDYTGAFDDLFAQYTNGAALDRVKTVNLGSMYELRYSVKLKDERREKEFIDALRCRNANLTVVLAKKSLQEAL